jgi:hypothetical protein
MVVGRTYWTVVGSGPDIVNGDSWKGGYTGTMESHGKKISYSAIQAGGASTPTAYRTHKTHPFKHVRAHTIKRMWRAADLVFYQNPDHVTIYIGSGKVSVCGCVAVCLVAVAVHLLTLLRCRRVHRL